MALSYKARRRWSLVILLIGLPAYIVFVVSILGAVGRLPFLLEVLVYIILGVAWMLPLKFVFLGVGKEDPDAKDPDAEE